MSYWGEAIGNPTLDLLQIHTRHDVWQDAQWRTGIAESETLGDKRLDKAITSWDALLKSHRKTLVAVKWDTTRKRDIHQPQPKAQLISWESLMSWYIQVALVLIRSDEIPCRVRYGLAIEWLGEAKLFCELTQISSTACKIKHMEYGKLWDRRQVRYWSAPWTGKGWIDYWITKFYW